MIYSILLLLILFSCDFDDTPVSVAGINQDELNYQKFNLNLENSDTIRRFPSIGESLLLYSGQDYAGSDIYSIFKFDNQIFSDYDLCDVDTISYKNLYLVIDLVNEYETQNDALIDGLLPGITDDLLPISAYWINSSDISLNLNDGSSISLNSNDFSDLDSYVSDSLDISFEDSNTLFINKYQDKYYIDLTSQLILNNQDNNCVNYETEDECNHLDLCGWKPEYELIINEFENPEYPGQTFTEYESDTTFSCSYLKNSINICNADSELSKLLLIKSNTNVIYEFASSNYISDYSNTEPYLNVLYDEFGELTNKSNKFILNTAIPDYSTTIHYISDTLLNNYNYVFVSNLFDESTVEELNDSLVWSDYTINTPLVDDNSLNEEFNLLNISLDLVNIENYSSSGLSLWLDNIKYMKYNSDFSSDNWIDLNNDGEWNEGEGLENNDQWDLGEYIEDYGLDLCSDKFEDGLGGCVLDSTLSAYNDQGTEGNTNWDFGESFKDYGIDGCSDVYEDGLGECNEELSCEDQNLDNLCDNGLDPNVDNYNNDPAKDDWFDVNNDGVWNEGEGLENNNQWDYKEPFIDIGLDGLSEDMVGYADDGENDNIYQFGEPYFDTGIDSLFSSDEIGYNVIGTQNDKLYQFGEPFDDCGVDSNCNDNDISDDYIIDPNNDNWIDSDDDGLWGEDEGTELNGLHDKDEFKEEYYEDYGLDNLDDSNELSLDNQKISVSMTDTVFFDYLNDDIVNSESFNQENDSLKIWISSIERKTDSNLEISISCLANHSVLGLEFQLKHDIYTSEVMAWQKKERNIAKVNSENYIKDFSIFNNSNTFLSSESNLFMNYAYGVSSVLNFDGFVDFIDINKDIIIDENNSYLKLFLNKQDPNFILESDNYIINFNKIDSTEINPLFSYFVQNNPDSLIVPIGNLLQQYINDIHNYKDGLLLDLNPNQYPPSYNFNNIVLDTNRSPVIEVYYFK